MFAQNSQVLTPHPTLPFFAHVRFRALLCHEFSSPDLLEGPKDRKIKENAKSFLS